MRTAFKAKAKTFRVFTADLIKRTKNNRKSLKVGGTQDAFRQKYLWKLKVNVLLRRF